jgi:protein-S-isoprenylcysteine O-methyltransferase Ste14
MRDSWRIGIIEGEKTELVTDGIFSISRNPYFLSGIIQFIAYIFLIKNLVVIIFCLLSILLIHKMVIKEETFLESLHGDKYLKYKKEVARYFII